MIVQSTNVSEVHKLYINQSMDLHTSVTVPVERDGEYRVSIFAAIRRGMGILGSSVQYQTGANPATTSAILTHGVVNNLSSIIDGNTRNSKRVFTLTGHE